MNCFRWIMCKLFGRRAVILHNSSGEMNIRLIRHWPYGKPHCVLHGFGIRTVFLNDGGTLTNGCYVKRWEPLPW